eukprot:396982_1
MTEMPRGIETVSEKINHSLYKRLSRYGFDFVLSYTDDGNRGTRMAIDRMWNNGPFRQWSELFNAMEDCHGLDPSNQMHIVCLHAVFMNTLIQHVQQWSKYWNTAYRPATSKHKYIRFESDIIGDIRREPGNPSHAMLKCIQDEGILEWKNPVFKKETVLQFLLINYEP